MRVCVSVTTCVSECVLSGVVCENIRDDLGE